MFTQASKTEYTAAAFHFPGTPKEFQRRHHHYQTLHLVQKLGHQSSLYNLPDPLWQRKSQQRNKVMHQVEKNKLLAKNAFNESAGVRIR